MRKCTALLILAALLLSGCAGAGKSEPAQYSVTYLTLFDTVTTILGQAESQEAFNETAQQLHDQLLQYHRLFDIYREYDSIANLKTINDNAGIAPVEVDKRIIALLQDCRDYSIRTGGKVNAAMGSVLSLWHTARTESLENPAQAYIPAEDDLAEAARHTDWDQVILDEAASTVYLADPAMSLDVGAIAKGWAAQQVAQQSPAGLLISVGGNVCATGPKDADGNAWVVGVQDPDDPSQYLQAISVTNQCVVTSGDYQRCYSVDGQSYHHIIDPETQMPGRLWRSVTIVCADSGLADALSTALFLLPREEGQALLDTYDAVAMWVGTDGTISYSDGFAALLAP